MLTPRLSCCRQRSWQRKRKMACLLETMQPFKIERCSIRTQINHLTNVRLPFGGVPILIDASANPAGDYRAGD
jgi:hypothetical protein